MLAPSLKGSRKLSGFKQFCVQNDFFFFWHKPRKSVVDYFGSGGSRAALEHVALKVLTLVPLVPLITMSLLCSCFVSTSALWRLYTEV